MESVNIMEKIEKVELVSGISAKTGKPYDFLDMTFKSGYHTAIFLKDDPMYIIKNIVSQES